MSQQQQRHEYGHQEQQKRVEEEARAAAPVTYGDLFGVQGHIADQPITKEDADMMQSAETRALGQTQKGGAASLMQSAAQLNERAGAGAAGEAALSERGVAVVEEHVPGRIVTTEYVAGNMVSRDSRPAPADYSSAGATDITIGEALEAAAVKGGDKPVEDSDAVAVQAAERRATGCAELSPGGVASLAQSAADVNPRLPYDERTTLRGVLSRAVGDLPADKAVTEADARAIKEAEMRHSATGSAYPGGVGDAMEAAARINERGGLNVLQ